jgi:hypothetical protein
MLTEIREIFNYLKVEIIWFLFIIDIIWKVKVNIYHGYYVMV